MNNIAAIKQTVAAHVAQKSFRRFALAAALKAAGRPNRLDVEAIKNYVNAEYAKAGATADGSW